MPPVVDDGDAAPTGYIPNGAAYGTNGSANGASYWAERGRVRPVARGAGRPRRPAQPRGRPLPARQRHARERWVRERRVRPRWVRERWVRRTAGMPTVCTPTGAIRTIPRPPRGPASAPTGTDRPVGPDREPDAGRELAADRDHVAGAGSDPDLWIEATVWASIVGSGAAPAVEAADAGADDWTVPMPVVRAAPVTEPEPVRQELVRPAHPERVTGGHDPGAAGSRSRRSRRAAEERAVGSPGWASQPESPERWRPERRPDEQPRSQWAESGWEAAGMSARGEPDRGAHASDRPRHGGHRAAEPGADPTGRAARRHASAHGRHSEERDDVAEPSGPAAPPQARALTAPRPRARRTLPAPSVVHSALHSPVHTGCTTPRGRGPRGQPPVTRLS